MTTLAALLHEEWDRRLCEPSEPGVPCPDCIESAARLAAAGVVVLTPETLAAALRKTARYSDDWNGYAKSILAALWEARDD